MSGVRRALSPGPSWCILSEPDPNADSNLTSCSSSDTEFEADQLLPSATDSSPANPSSLKRPKQTALNFFAQKRVRIQDETGKDAAAMNSQKRCVATKSIPFRVTSTVYMSSKDQELIQSPSKPNRSQRKPSSNMRLSSPTTSSSFSPPPLDQLPSSPSGSKNGRKRASGHGVNRTPKEGQIQTKTNFLGSIEICSSSEEDCETTSTPRKPGATITYIEISSDSEGEKAPRKHRIRRSAETIHKATPKPPSYSSEATSSKSSLFLRDKQGTDSSNVYIWDVNIAGTRSDFDTHLRNDSTLEVPRSSSGSSELESPTSSLNSHTPKIFEKSCAFFGHSMPSNTTQPQASSSSCSSRRGASSNRGSVVPEKEVVDFLRSCITKPRPKPRKIPPRRQTSANRNDDDDWDFSSRFRGWIR
ncbi:hypothetical protein E1B28_008338 [Marasmius oreades]|uniref:Uncharacterized protein n=1 Tax=Marasmius oreades TaxID=181124 RepID=A0A9P7RZS2_9AGAR|nr:uncharacterized protein E1B28_008338 [Marasmius oreades]KAG7091948.1 hypothetical protein E1B28_008338 [Marasmius oreades]